MIGKIFKLRALHDPSSDLQVLPREGAASIGRRPTNSIVCPDQTVSGHHCTIHCQPGVGDGDPQLTLEDFSTNGTYVNENKLSKGQKENIVDRDVISLTKPREDGDPEFAAHGPRVQYQVEVCEVAEGTVAPAVAHQQQEQKTSQFWPLATPNDAADGKNMENCFAQDLLVQEQQSKAKITGELLLSQRRFEEERQKAEVYAKDLKRVRQQIDEERARRKSAEEAKDRLVAEAKQLQTERQQLQDLRTSHTTLQERHEAVEIEFTAQKQRIASMEVEKERCKAEAARAIEQGSRADQEKAEAQTRLRQVGEKVERAEQQAIASRKELEGVQQEVGRLQRELHSEQSAREALEDQVSLLRAEVERAEAAEKTVRDDLEAATAQRAELEAKVSSCKAEADSARKSMKEVQQRLDAELLLIERLREAGRKMAGELRNRADLYEQSLFSGNFEEVKTAVPTFAEVTCRDDTHEATKSEHGAEGDAPMAIAAVRSNLDEEAGTQNAPQDLVQKTAEAAPSASGGTRSSPAVAAVIIEDEAPKLLDAGAGKISPSPNSAAVPSAQLLPSSTSVAPGSGDVPGMLSLLVDQEELIVPPRVPPQAVQSVDISRAAETSAMWSLEVLDLNEITTAEQPTMAIGAKRNGPSASSGEAGSKRAKR